MLNKYIFSIRVPGSGQSPNKGGIPISISSWSLKNKKGRFSNFQRFKDYPISPKLPSWMIPTLLPGPLPVLLPNLLSPGLFMPVLHMVLLFSLLYAGLGEVENWKWSVLHLGSFCGSSQNFRRLYIARKYGSRQKNKRRKIRITKRTSMGSRPANLA